MKPVSLRPIFPWFFLIASITGLFCATIIYQHDTRIYFSLKPLAAIYVSLAIILCGVAVIIDSWRLQILGFFADNKLSFKTSVRSVLIYAFFSAITPTSLGGEASQIWMLHNARVSPQASITITILRSLLPFGILALIVPLMRFFIRIPPGSMLEKALHPIILFGAGAIIMICLILCFHRYLTMFLESKYISRWHKESWFWKQLYRVLNLFSEVIMKFFNRKKIVWMCAAIILTFLHLLAMFSIAPVAALAFGVKISYLQAVLGVAALHITLLFVPLPGGAGLAEVGFPIVIGSVAPPDILVPLIFLWRFSSSYLRIIIGGCMLLFVFRNHLKWRLLC